MSTSSTTNIFIIENLKLKVSYNNTIGRIDIIHKINGSAYSSTTPFYFIYGNSYAYNLPQHCKTSIKRTADKLTFYFDEFEFWARFKGHGYHKPEPGPDLKFEFSIILKDDHIIFRTEKIQNMDEEECAVNFPHGLLEFSSQNTAQLIFPFGFGSMFEFPRNDYFIYSTPCERPQYSLPLYALFEPGGGLGVYLKNPYDMNTTVSINSKTKGWASVESSFSFERKNANYAREVHIYPMLKGQNYIDLAKLYRHILKKEKRFVSLQEKIDQNPDVEKLVGSVIWKHNVYSGERPAGVKKNYSLYMLDPEQNEYEGLPNNWTAKEVFDTAKERGFDRVCVYNTGWNNKGFDSGYPTRFPPNPERGTEEQFKIAADYGRSLSQDYIYSVHDNYLDVYDNSPEFNFSETNTRKDGSPEPGGIWRGGRAYLMCTSQSSKYLTRDIPHLAEMLGKGSIYIDVLGCAKLESCHNPSHPQGKREDVASRRTILKFIKQHMGSVATEGTPGDCYADIVDLGAYCYYHMTASNPLTEPIPVPIPLWQLVYHDSLLNYTSESTFKAYGSEYILYMALYALLPTQFDDVSKKLSLELRDTYKAEMISHEFIEKVNVKRDSNGCFWSDGVAKTVFSDGTNVIANFRKTSYEYKGQLIPARDFIITKQA